MQYQIKPSQLSGSITVPPSKSHTLRAILFASLADGKSIIHNYLHSPDADAMINACQLMGANILVKDKFLSIIGTNGKPKAPDNIIDAGNSGQVLRFIAAIAALIPEYTIITGDKSIRYNRPTKPLIEGLNQLNVFATTTKNNICAPLIIKGPLVGGKATISGEDSQPVSGLLIACAFAQKQSIINVNNPGEKPWIDLTLDWFNRLGIKYQRDNYSQYIINGNSNYQGFNYSVPGDFSSAAFLIVAALITNSEICLNNLDLQDSQGDKQFITDLIRLGAKIDIDKTNNKLIIKKQTECTPLKIKELNINNYIDALPILAVLGCFCREETIITGARIARTKESNRITAIATELQKMGAKINEHDDGLIIHPCKLTGTEVTSHNDHRIAMALAVAGLVANDATNITDTDCVHKSYPNFVSDLKMLGALIESKI